MAVIEDAEGKSWKRKTSDLSIYAGDALAAYYLAGPIPAEKSRNQKKREEMWEGSISIIITLRGRRTVSRDSMVWQSDLPL